MKRHLVKHVKSYGYALAGVREIFNNQLNFRIEVVAAILVVIVGFIFKITVLEWGILVFIISLVLICEGINSAIEAMCDALNKNFDEDIKYAKDVSSGMVLLAATASVIIGVIIFLPYVLKL
jgi:diacylglycerol kinase